MINFITDDMANNCRLNSKGVEKMKQCLTIIILLAVVGSTYGAHFSYCAGGFRASCEVYAEDYNYYDGPYSDTNDSTSSAMVEEYAEVPDAYSYANNAVWDSNDSRNHSICIRMNSFADMLADNADSNGFGYGYATSEDLETYGIFYEIVPGQGETIGDDVTVYIVSTIKVAAWGQTYAYVGGPADLSYIAVTKGLLPPVLADPATEYEVFGIENLELADESFDWCSGVYSFNTKIGDVIGIFAESYTDVSGQGPLDGVVESDLTIALTAITLLPGDLNDDGYVDFYDFSVFADNWLEGTP